ncbi:microtubule-associated protein 1S-like isoform X2 [Tachysurus fulvidraco]|uniref:microtubule-associated protein 1S-like isoform X2 n=1 Tax=Tachysurus fulvidraco TaxID=1234273 RepID=UPI001FEDBF41|nr:microtubule-associated protein 1S-like isoform X2 [Tachysurus fulvidraco]XP_047678018.1 microtubule-associated protein 1S-like isoform X2 [Tachysurus fulvidraco]
MEITEDPLEIEVVEVKGHRSDLWWFDSNHGSNESVPVISFKEAMVRDANMSCIDEKTLELRSPKSGQNIAGHKPYHISPEETWAPSDRSSLTAKMCLGSDSQQGASESGCPKNIQKSNSSSSKEKHSSFLSLSCFKDIIPDISPTVTTDTHSMPAEASSPPPSEVEESLSMSVEQVLPTASESTNEDETSYSNGHYGDPDFKVDLSLPVKMADYELSAWPEPTKSPVLSVLWCISLALPAPLPPVPVYRSRAPPWLPTPLWFPAPPPAPPWSPVLLWSLAPPLAPPWSLVLRWSRGGSVMRAMRAPSAGLQRICCT